MVQPSPGVRIVGCGNRGSAEPGPSGGARRVRRMAARVCPVRARRGMRADLAIGG
ncbi:hypothetical protein D9X30_3414 [Cupriavidus sp. U2]|nr:hypothetical protein D9X30_3414 [Cupriavidus sp. U2]